MEMRDAITMKILGVRGLAFARSSDVPTGDRATVLRNGFIDGARHVKQDDYRLFKKSMSF
jgi:hypothetical protein